MESGWPAHIPSSTYKKGMKLYIYMSVQIINGVARVEGAEGRSP